MTSPKPVRPVLRELGVHLPPEIVEIIVRHLKKGGKQNELYPKYASNNTVLKIKKLLDSGKLEILTREAAQPDELISNYDFSAGMAMDKSYEENVFRLKITRNAEKRMPKDWEWSIKSLEKIGIRDALDILKDFDRLFFARDRAEIKADPASFGIPHPYLRKFKGFERYLYLLHLVSLASLSTDAPYNYLTYASDLYTRGVLKNDISIWTTAEGILRYAIWESDQNQVAFHQSLQGLYRALNKKMPVPLIVIPST